MFKFFWCRIMLEDCKDIHQAEAKLSTKLRYVTLIGEIDFSYKDVSVLANFIKDKIQSSIRDGTEFLENQAPLCLACYLTRLC